MMDLAILEINNPYQNGFSNHNYVMDNVALKSMCTVPYPSLIFTLALEICTLTE
jgi:hypothetical protein